jgi:hypothetical protein
MMRSVAAGLLVASHLWRQQVTPASHLVNDNSYTRHTSYVWLQHLELLQDFSRTRCKLLPVVPVHAQQFLSS